MRLREVMSPTVCIRYEERTGETLERMRAAGLEHLIITKKSGIAGVVSKKDLELACSENAEAPVGNTAIDVPILRSDATLREAAKLMRSRNVGCVPVVDGDVIAGVVTIETLLDLIGRGTVAARRAAKKEA